VDVDERVRRAYSPALFAECAERWQTQLAAYLTAQQSRSGPVFPGDDPATLIAAARACLDQPPPALDEVAQRWSSLLSTMLEHTQNLQHPRYIGHQVPAPLPLATLADAVGSLTNQPMAIFEMGPWGTAVERALAAALGERIGYPPDSFTGVITHGGSLANLTALLTARNVALPESWKHGCRGASPVLLVQGDAHYSIARAAGMLGVGTEHVVPIALDERRRMRPDALRTALQAAHQSHQTVIAVVATAGTTPIGAFDPLVVIAAICREFGVWLHVDAAHGGAACLSPRLRPLLAGAEQADSLVWDAHKLLFVPALCTFLFYRDRDRRFDAFQQNAPYLFDPAAPGRAEFDVGLQTVECTKRSAGYGLWAVWCLFGPELLATLVDSACERATRFVERIRSTDDFVALHEPQSNIVVFRYLPATWKELPASELGRRQMQLRRNLIESGNFYITSTMLDGVGALRITIMNPLTTERDLEDLLDALRDRAQA
jgi:L-2,4-diaminobutyrate decarboxylase